MSGSEAARNFDKLVILADEQKATQQRAVDAVLPCSMPPPTAKTGGAAEWWFLLHQ